MKPGPGGPQRNTQPGGAKTVRIVLAILLLAAGGLFLWLAVLDYPHAKALADLFSPDRDMQAFTHEWFRRLHLVAILGVLSGLGLGGGLLAFPRRCEDWLRGLPGFVGAFFRRLPGDARRSAHRLGELFRNRTVLASLLGLILLAVLAHVFFLQSPFQHDEAYSFTIFAVKPLSIGLRDYHFPNNHLFQTFWMHLSYLLFGAQDWSVRLPAFLAGALLAPLAYLLGRRWYGQRAGLLAGAAVAVAPIVTSYSTNARGYTLVALFGLAIFALGSELLRTNNRFLWVCLPVLSALGFYSVPVFLYPFGMLYTWLGLAWLRRKYAGEYTQSGFFFDLLISALAALGLTGLLYLPVISYSGFDAVFANPWVVSLSWKDFFPTLLSRLGDIRAEWTLATAPLVALTGLLGLLAGFFLPRRAARRMPLLTQSSLLFVPLILLAQRPNPWAKTWFFLYPLLLVWSAGGLAGLVEWIVGRTKLPLRWNSYAVSFLLAGLVVAAGQHTLAAYPGLKPVYGPLEQSVRYLDGHLQTDQVVVADAPDDAPVWYYFYKYGLSQQTLRRDVPFEAAYVLVDSAEGQTLASVVKDRGPDENFFAWDTAQVVASYGTVQVYQVQADREAVRKAYAEITP